RALTATPCIQKVSHSGASPRQARTCGSKAARVKAVNRIMDPPSRPRRCGATRDLIQISDRFADLRHSRLIPRSKVLTVLAPIRPRPTPDLIAKYDGRAPRYTSYPTAVQFTPQVQEDT